MYIKNRTSLPLYVTASGSVSSPSRVDGMPPDLIGALLARMHPEAEVVPPGYEVAMSVDGGAGGVSVQPASTEILETYGIAKVAFGYVPYSSALLNDAAEMVTALDDEVAEARNCLNGANVLKKVWCSTVFGTKAAASIGAFGISAGMDALKEGPKRIAQILWGLLQEGKYIFDVGKDVFGSGATNLTVAAAPPAGPGPAPDPGPGPGPGPGPAPASSWTETTGGETHTWTDYNNAGGEAGPVIPGGTSVQVACKVPGFKVANGNTWWYRIASWNGRFYASADAFYNNGQTSGSLKGTPWVDPAVGNC